MKIKEYPATLIRRQETFSQTFELVVTDPTKEDFNELHFAVKFERQMVIEASRQRGKWIWKSYDMKHDCGDIVCSKCSCVTYEGVPAERLKGKLWDYCPACGSDNRKEQTNG